MLQLKPIGQASAAHLPSRLSLSLLAAACLVSLAACNDNGSPKAAAPAPLAAPAPTPEPTQPVQAAYTPPSADVLYQMVAPIALYPDKLVAQVLAGATYPDQISAAEVWLGQNPGLQKAALVAAVNSQSWDPSVKSLTEFPNVLAQLAGNIPWTTALGKAYYNDPSDVLNAIQVMRGRAVKAGSLKSSQQLKVQAAAQAASTGYSASDSTVPFYGHPVITPPEQFIQIEPTQVATVYVPQYDPAIVYGTPVPLYHSYRSIIAPPPQPAVVVGSAPVVAGIIGFGAGVVLATAVESRPNWGWHSWDMHWGEHDHDWRPGNPPPPPQARPAVVYNNRTYVSQSTTVVENIHNNVHTTQITNNTVVPGNSGPGLNAGMSPPAGSPAMHGLATTAAVGAVAAGGAAMALAARHDNPAAMAQRQAPAPTAQTPIPARPAVPTPLAAAASAPHGTDARHRVAALPAAAPADRAVHASAPLNTPQAPHAPAQPNQAPQRAQAAPAPTAAQQQAEAQRQQAAAQAQAQQRQQQALAEQQSRQRQQQEAAQRAQQQDALRAQQVQQQHAQQEQQRAQQQAQRQAEQRAAPPAHAAAAAQHAPMVAAAPRPAPAPHAAHPAAREHKHER
ncbi:DUF3300 domain-containing protein [Comamonas sp. J-3]|uniref:DUF3300 domain-containing protein n=1 Tax=Comamonas trifloxystrobinivorans TaxID=3350256 RepID=UPI00372661F7